MRVDFGLPSRGADEAPVSLTIGNFDGVHRGHRALIDALVSDARGRNGEAVVMTFDPHPRCVLDPDNCPQQITTLDEKREVIATLGVDRLVVLEFTRELSQWTAEHFCEQLLESFALSRLVVGHDFALGNKRRGDIAFLRDFGASHGVDVQTVDALALDGEVVSASLVRGALLGGELPRAAQLLGRTYFADSWVEHTDSVERLGGMPSAHLSITPGKCLPARGIYATWLRLRGRWRMAATNVGYGPTFGHDRLAVEALLLDFEGDLYRQQVRAAFVERLREERRFAGAEELGAQIAVDVERARAALSAAGEPAGL